jgi:hypothetical protein
MSSAFGDLAALTTAAAIDRIVVARRAAALALLETIPPATAGEMSNAHIVLAGIEAAGEELTAAAEALKALLCED